MATSSVNFVSALGAGSGIDVKQLAQDLVDTEKAPRKAAIDAKIAKSEARISGYALMKFSLSELQTAFKSLNDQTDFNSLTTSNSQSTAFGVTTSATATAATHSITVTNPAQAQRTACSWADTTSSVNDGNAFTIDFTINGTVHTVNVTTDTAQGVADAVNAADIGISVQLINTGSGATPYTMVFTGAEGADNAFTMVSDYNGSPVPALNLNTIQTALDANLTVDGVDIVRGSNTISDVIDGVTLNLYGATTGAARLELARDTTSLKEKFTALVTAYNDFEDNMKILADRDSTVESYGGALAGDSLLQTIRSQVRAMITTTSSTPGSTLTAARDAGLSFDRYGKMTLDENMLDAALANHFEDVATLFSADTNDQSVYSVAPGGVAGDAVNKIDALLRSTGLIATQSQSASAQVTQYQDDLTALEDRMTTLLERYTAQFSVMESVVGQSNSLRASLTSTFEGMMATYTKK